MADNIAIGSLLKITITKPPTSRAATKTLVRLLSKDKGHAKMNRRHARIRKEGFTQSQRGGRFWDVHMVKQNPLAGKQGETGTVVATLDVLTDLKSVERFVEVTPA